MIVEGERVKALIGGAASEVLLCAPFIKAKVFGVILNAAPPSIAVRVVTRWRPAEVAAGLSDLEVFDITNDRPNTELALFDSLHAKLYVADDHCLVGSANLTASALGWRPDSNLEILMSARRSDPDITLLLERLESASPATYQVREKVAKEAAALEKPPLDESQDMPPGMVEVAQIPWLPRCATPEKLHKVYLDPDKTTIAAEGTRADAVADLQALAPPSGLNESDFTVYMRGALSQIPSIQRILERIPAGMADSQGEEIVSDILAQPEPSDTGKQWRIVRDWIGVFFQDRFEVAPQSYVVRLKPR